MFMTDEILERAKLYISKTLTDSGTEGLRLLCSSAEIRIRRLLRDDVDPEEIREIIITASALLALSLYASVTGDTFTSAKIGSISITKTSGKSFPEELRNVAQTVISPYAEEADFKFLGVKG